MVPFCFVVVPAISMYALLLSAVSFPCKKVKIIVGLCVSDVQSFSDYHKCLEDHLYFLHHVQYVVGHGLFRPACPICFLVASFLGSVGTYFLVF